MLQTGRPALVVVGTGLAGARVVEEVLARAPDRFAIRMFGAEPHGTYNRIHLSSVLGGFKEPDELWLNPLEWYDSRSVLVHAGVCADHIDPDKRVVTGGGGKVVEPYDHLVLATGSRPFVPTLPGSNQQGVFVFRTLEDCGKIVGYAQECDRAVVLGGGLLGLEAARGLLSHGVEVTVVELAPHLMIQQLDPAGAELLKRKLEALGVRVHLGTTTAELLGDGRVRGLRLQDGSTLDTDMVVISCGIRANVEEARSAGLAVERGIIVDDQLRTSDLAIFAVGECAQHRGKVYGLVDPVYEQARVLADVLTGARPEAAYHGSRLATTLKVMGVQLTSMGDVTASGPDDEVLSHLDPARGTYRKLVLRDGRLAGCILLGNGQNGDRISEDKGPVPVWAGEPMGMLLRLFRNQEPIPGEPLDLLIGRSEGTPLENTRDPLLDTHGPVVRGKRESFNKLEVLKAQKDGLDSLPDILRLAQNNNWAEMTEDDKHLFKWHGLFFRKQTPGNFMLRLRLEAGRCTARQLRVIADLTDEYGKGFCDLTTRQQIQLRWFTLADMPDIWRRLAEVGLHSKQTGMDNVRGVCGCPLAGLTPHELLDATPVVSEFTRLIVDNKEFTNLPRKFNVTITGCLENCCHTETQDIALVPAYRELEGQQVNGFNVLVGGKQGSGGYRPAVPLDVFVRPEHAAALCGEITRIFRDHGGRATRTRARLAFLIEDRSVAWLRNELARRLGQTLLKAGTDLRKPHHTDHLGIHPQKRAATHSEGPPLYHVGLLVPVGRITTPQLCGVADLAERYGNGEVRVTVQQNLVIPNIPETRIGALADEPLFQELPYDPSPVMRGLVTCTGTDYCHLALIDTKGYALDIARELERRTAGSKVQPLTTHWSGCSAGCGLHQVATIGLQGVRARVKGSVVDAAHIGVRGQSGPEPRLATDLMYDVPCDQLVDILEPFVMHLPR